MNQQTGRITVGILAHVDAGKTTLAEAMLYTAGSIRKQGRVDSGNTAMDTHIIERERGITIFSSQAVLHFGNREFVLLDTPGHVDFSAETERTLQVLDCAVLVISGLDGVQAHTRTLWRLLSLYHVPTVLFVTKMDFARHTEAEILAGLQKELSPACLSFADGTAPIAESLAMCREDVLEKYLDSGEIADTDVASLVRERLVFPCLFGSGLKNQGITELMHLLSDFVPVPVYPSAFAAKIYKITHDSQGVRLTHMKITGGTLRVRDALRTGEKEEKVAAIRVYNGAKFTAADEISAGGVCAVVGLEQTQNGQGLGMEACTGEPVLEPVMVYGLLLPEGTDARTLLPKLHQLEEEDPLLHFTWNNRIQEIQCSLLGEVQAEILRSIIAERFGVDVRIDTGRVLYKETIADTVEGVGHYEPLRHYAEVHLLLEPLPLGTGLRFESNVGEDMLDRNWQRLILGHLTEKTHLGVLTGSPITDMKITLAAGRAHLKHTEGGDFRQSTYRAVRQGLMQAESVLLEPYDRFTLWVPPEQMGRAINDIRMKHGSFDSPENEDGMTVIRGKAPTVELNGYAAEVVGYTAGKGRFLTEQAGYDICHNREQVIAEYNYDPLGDLENSPDSVFCAHGSGFPVRWDKVPEYMHIESCLKKEKSFVPLINHRNLHIDDKELEKIMEREFGPVRIFLPQNKEPARPEKVLSEKAFIPRKEYVIVDGYNVIFAWDDLKKTAKISLEEARLQLQDILCNYAAYTKYEVILVFDAYKVNGSRGEKFRYNNIHVVYTKERELGDVYIEKLIAEIGKNDKVRVITGDAMIQLSAVRFGVQRMSAVEFEREIDAVSERIGVFIEQEKQKSRL